MTAFRGDCIWFAASALYPTRQHVAVLFGLSYHLKLRCRALVAGLLFPHPLVSTPSAALLTSAAWLGIVSRERFPEFTRCALKPHGLRGAILTHNCPAILAVLSFTNPPLPSHAEVSSAQRSAFRLHFGDDGGTVPRLGGLLSGLRRRGGS